MITFRCFTALFFTTILFFQSVFAQEVPPRPIEWGEISKADLEMKSFPEDTNASAVILCDYGESTVDNNINLKFYRHVRIKILNQKGFDWGTHSFVINEDRERGEYFDEIEGVTYVLKEDGEVEEIEFDDDDVFKEELGNEYVRYKFTMPGLKPGCVIEFQYTITSQSLWRVRDWSFQHSEPVLWSEYRLLHPVALGYTSVWSGYERFAVSESEQVKILMINPPMLYGSNPILHNFQRWALKNAPALRDEPFITTIDDYNTKVDIQFSGYADDIGIKRVLDTWETTVQELWDSGEIGGRIEVTSKIKETVTKITAGLQSAEEKARAIYTWVSSSIVWTGKNAIDADQEVDDVLESKKGDNAEITYTLISMLAAANIPAQPVILSTRDHGKLQELYPILNQFNYVLAKVTIGSKSMFIDATNPLRAMHQLPSKVLNVRGVVLQPKKVEWVTIGSPAKSSTTALATVRLGEDGSLSGTIEGIFKEYTNAGIRSSLKESNLTEVAKKYFETDASGLQVDSAFASVSDTVSIPVKMTAHVSAAEFAQSGGEMIYLNPHIVSRWKDNPFKSNIRKFPVDYNYPREYSSIISIALPDSFEVKEGLKDKTITLADGSVKYRRFSALHGERIQLTTKFEILSQVVGADYYQQLRELYASMIGAESEQIVLQRKVPAAPAPAATEPPKEESKKPASKKTKKS
ncbi:MAG: transglutaminase domain-containing protein [Bacteroidota bacterium]